MRSKKKFFSLSFKISLLVMIVSFLGISALSYIVYLQSKEIFIKHSAEILKKDMKNYRYDIIQNIKKLKYNTTLIAYSPTTNGFIRSYLSKYKYDTKTNKTYNQYKQDMISTLKLMIKQNPSYYQIRVINLRNGREILKLIKNDNHIHIVKDKNLQNKLHTKYVQDALQIKDKNSIYVSDINLNREFGNIEFPIKPTIRVAKVVYTGGKKSALVLINANAFTIFGIKGHKLDDVKSTKTFITDAYGNYLYNPTYQDKEFGFEFGKEYKVFDDFPFLSDFYRKNRSTFSFLKPAHNIILEARKIYISKDKHIIIIKLINTNFFDTSIQNYMDNLTISILIITLIITLITTLLVRLLTKPIKRLTRFAQEIAQTKEIKNSKIEIYSSDEIGELSKSFNAMLTNLNESKEEISQFAKRLEKEVDIKTKELQEVNKNLQIIVREKVDEIVKKDAILSQQAKLAAMGEMIGAIAHQWRQPLNSLAINIQLLIDMAEAKECDVKNVEKFVHKNMQTIYFMSNTIDDFRNFFRKDKTKETFSIKEAVEKTLKLQIAQLNNNDIEVILHLEPIYTYGYKNEFMQAVLNIISNAKDAIIDKKDNSENFTGKIEIELFSKENNAYLVIQDNAGGIKREVIDRIFEPYFTTKEEGKGTGMGLYMSKEIIERMSGEIRVENANEGARFIIVLKRVNP